MLVKCYIQTWWIRLVSFSWPQNLNSLVHLFLPTLYSKSVWCPGCVYQQLEEVEECFLLSLTFFPPLETPVTTASLWLLLNVPGSFNLDCFSFRKEHSGICIHMVRKWNPCPPRLTFYRNAWAASFLFPFRVIIVAWSFLCLKNLDPGSR